MEQLNLKLTLNANGSITVSWSPIAGAVRYSALMHQVGASTVIYNQTNLTTTSYTSQANLEANQQYSVTVVAYSSSVSLTSEAAKVLIPLEFYDNAPLSTPQNVRAVAGSTVVTVSFDKVERATNYDILFDGSVYNVTGTSKQFTGLQPKTNHTYAVRAKNTSVTGSYSTTQTITTLSGIPAIPSGVKKVATEKSMTISWNADSEATGYELQFNGKVYYLTDTSKKLTGLKSNTKYSCKLRAKNASGYSGYHIFSAMTTPAAPVSTNAVSTDTSVTVNWGQVNGARGYGVRVGTKVGSAALTESSFTFEGLKPNTNYNYQVCSKGYDGESSYSTAKSIKTLEAIPGPPKIIKETSTEKSVTISWEAVTGITQYDVLAGSTSHRITGTTITFNLAANTSLTYQIRCVKGSRTGEYSAVRTVTTTPKAPESTGVVTSENSITVSWDAVDGASSYDVLFDGEVYHVTGTSQTFTDLKPNTEYRYQVRVNNVNGSSSYNEERTVKTAPVFTKTSQTVAAKDSVTISWDAVDGATSYDVLFDGKVHHVTGTTATITGLVPGTEYEYSIRANNEDGSGAYGETKKVATIPNCPDTPTNIHAVATVDSVTISWDAMDGATSYKVSFDGAIYDVTGTSKKITGLSQYTEYRYAVSAINAGGSSAYSAEQAIRTQKAAPGVPTGIGAEAKADRATISWNSVLWADSYDVLFDGTVHTVTETFCEITGLKANTAYVYQVRAKNEVGDGAYSAAKTIRTLLQTPENIRAEATRNSVTVSFDAVEMATDYDIKFDGEVYPVTGGGAASAVRAVLAEVSAGVSRIYKVFSGLKANTEHHYCVRANNAEGSSDYSLVQTIQTDISKKSGMTKAGKKKVYPEGRHS